MLEVIIFIVKFWVICGLLAFTIPILTKEIIQRILGLDVIDTDRDYKWFFIMSMKLGPYALWLMFEVIYEQYFKPRE